MPPVHQQPGGGANPPPAAAVAAPATPHVFQHVVVPGTDGSLDYWACPANAKLVSSLPGLGWVDSSAIVPGTRAAPSLCITAALCPGCHFDWSAPAFAPALLMPELLVAFTAPAMARAADGLGAVGLFDKTFGDSVKYLEAYAGVLPKLPAPSPLELAGPADLVIISPFDTPGQPAVAAVPAVPAQAAVPAVPAQPAVAAVRARRAAGGRPAVRAVPGQPAVPAQPARPAVPAQPAVAAIPAIAAVAGPAELKWLSLLLLGHTVDTADVLPFLAFARRALLMPDRTSVLARADPTSHVRAVGDVLLRWVQSSIGFAPDPSLARHFRTQGGRITALPDALRSGSFEADVLESELIDDISYSSGEVAKKDTVTLSRLEFVGSDYPDLHDFLNRVPSRPAKGTAIARLSVVLPSHVAKLPLFDRLVALDTFLEGHSALLTQCWNKGMSVTGLDGVLELLIKELEESKADRPTDRGQVEDLNDAALVGPGRGLSDAARQRALQDTAFVDSSEDILALDLSTPAGRKEALSIACLAECVIYQRFFAAPSSLLRCHAVFKALYRCFDQLPAYFGGAQAADPATGVVEELRENWTFPTTSITLVFGGKLSRVPFFNGAGGALALSNLTASEPFMECPVDQLYTVVSVLELTIPFVRATMAAAGWKATSSVGYTLPALYERQLAHVKWIQGMGTMEIAELLPHAHRAFLQALLDADVEVARLMDDPEPVERELDHVLAFGGDYDNQLARKTAGAKPLVVVRQAFPHLLPSGKDRSLPGVTLPGGAGGSGGGGVVDVGANHDKDKSKDKNKDKAKDKGKGKDGVRPPGSQSGLVSWTDSTHMQLGPLIYDVQSIADHYQVSPTEVCWPVLCSLKKGGHALALCPCWGQPGHTALTSSAHVKPKGWDVAHIDKHFTAKAAPAGAKRGRQNQSKK